MSEPTEAIVASNHMGALRPADVLQQVQLVQEVMAAVMKDGEHYGAIPGCGSKPALLQPGAQVLAFTFRLAPSFAIERQDLGDGHREYEAICRLTSINTGVFVGEGIGSATTMESKHRYRNVSDYEVTDMPIPADAKERKAEYRRQGYGMKKVDDVWKWVKWTSSDKVENPDIADTYNTVRKMAAKRAFVHAVINTLAVSDMFTQDIEDLAVDNVFAAEKADETTLKKLRGLKAALDVSADTYLEQLEKVSGTAVSGDTDLTQEAAERLIGAYLRRMETKGDEPTEAGAPDGEETR